MQELLDCAIKDLELVGSCKTCGNSDVYCEINPDSCTGYKWRGLSTGRIEKESQLQSKIRELFEYAVMRLSKEAIDGEVSVMNYWRGYRDAVKRMMENEN